MPLSDQFVAYLSHYSDKNISKISGMFANDITLRDWKISVSGKATAIAETQKNFDSAKTIEIEILHTYEAEQAVTGELRIVVNETEVLYVVDVVTFNTNNQIKSVRAYLGRGD
ncbi:nuclear transport factor 2 family protein [bacterium AH-315-K03]|nr:nuclear transport factor 2 family protein [bacterium AH-315-K03]